MPVDVGTRHVFAYGATTLQLADEHTMAFVSGSTIQFISTVTNSQHLLTRNKSRKLVAFDFNWRNSEFVITSRDPNPEILIYSYPDKKLRGKLQNGGASMEYSHLKYSRCGRRLISLRTDDITPAATAKPSDSKPVVSRLCVWDLEKYEPLKGCGNASVTIDVAFLSFDPANSDHFLLGGADGVQLWKIYKGKASYSLRQVTIKLRKWSTTSSIQANTGSSRGQPTSGHHNRSSFYDELGDDDGEPQDADERRNQLVCHAWMRGNRVLLANKAGELFIVDTSATAHGSELVGLVIDSLIRPNRCCIVGIIYTTETIVVVYADGHVAWLHESDYSVIQTANLPCTPSHAKNDGGVESVIASVAPSPNYSKVYIGTCDGHIYEVRVAVVSDEDEPEGGEEAIGSSREVTTSMGGALTSRRSPQTSVTMTNCGSFHVGSVFGSAPLTPCGSVGTGDVVIASGGSDGRLYFWSVSKCRLVAEVNLLGLFASIGNDTTGEVVEPNGNGNTSAEVTSAPSSSRSDITNRDRSEETNATSSSGVSSDHPIVVITSLAARAVDPILVVGDQRGKLRILCVSKQVGNNGGLELLPLQSLQLLDPHSPLDLLVMHPTQPYVLVASTLNSHVFVVSLDPEQQFRVLAYISLRTENECIVDLNWSIQANFPSISVFTVSTSSGKFYCVRHLDPASGSLPIQLTPNVVVLSDKEMPVLQCAHLHFLPDAPTNLFLFISPKSRDIYVLGFADTTTALIQASDKVISLPIQTKVVAQDAHESGIVAIAIYDEKLQNGEELVATAGANGMITLWLLSHSSLEAIQLVKKKTIVPHLGVITSLSFLRMDMNEVFLVTTGIDGSVCLLDVRISNEMRGTIPPWNVSSVYSNLETFAKYENPFVPDSLDEKEAIRPYLDLLKDELATVARNRFDRLKDKTRAHLNDLKLKLKMLLSENEELPESERLAREEFVINTEWRDRIVEKNGKRAEVVREGILRDLAKINIVRERMKAEFWDSASVPGIRLRGLTPTPTPLFVYNFPMRQLSKPETLRMKRIELLRLIEYEHQKQELMTHSTNESAISRLQQVVSPGLQWLINAGLLHPAINPKGKKDVASSALVLSLPVLNEIKAFHLVYHPIAIRTRKQQRTQILLVKSYIRSLLVEFNREFQELVHLKQVKMEEIETKNTRIQEIVRELGQSVASIELFRPQWASDEIATSILEVHADEMTQVPYESEEARKRREQEAAHLDALERQRQQDDVAGRALRDMMNGTLEVKKEHLVQQTLIKETWMNEIPLEEMTAEQKKLVTQFEIAQQKLREEQEKYKKSLDLELKKIKSEIQDICRTFDDKVRMLRDQYLSMRMNILIQQLYELRLAEDLVQHEHLIQQVERIQERIEEFNREQMMYEKENQVFHTQVEIARDEWHRAMEEERLLEKGFIREIEEQTNGMGLVIDHEMTKCLVELYKKRKTEDVRTNSIVPVDKKIKKPNLPVGGSKRRLLTEINEQSTRQVSTVQLLQSLQVNDTNVDRESNLDPFSDVDMPPSTKTKVVTQRHVVPLDYDIDRPDGITLDERLWRVLNELRTRKILAEQNVKERAEQFNQARTVADELRVQVQELENAIQEQNVLLDATKRQLKALADNTPLLVAIKQGQDETIVLDRDQTSHDALLVARSSVESLNEVIQLHGKDQVSILHKIKNFRKNINVMEWEHKLLEMETKDMEERYTDIQLLRVTKELQELFHTGDTSEKQKRQVTQLEAKLDHVGKHHQLHLLKLDQTHRKLQSQIRERKRENQEFQQQVQQLHRQVQIRQDIVASHQTAALRHTQLASGHDMSQNAKMKAISVRRKLIDLARAQTEEIDYLRMELDKMRRRTFPSFAHHHLAKDYHPSDTR